VLDVSHTRVSAPTTLNMMQMAAAHHRAGRLREAEQIYRRVLLDEPDHADALHGLGLLCLQEDRGELAAAFFGRAVRANPSVGVYHYNQGEAWLMAGQAAQAAACFRRAVELDPDRPQPHAALGVALGQMGCWREAIDALQRAVELGLHRAEVYRHLADALFNTKRAEEAEAAARRAVELDPDVAESWHVQGQALDELDRTEEALACFRRAMQLKPGFALPHYGVGLALARRQRLDEAAESFRQALRLRPEFPEALSGLGSLLLASGKTDEGIDHLRQAVRLRPTLRTAQAELAHGLERAGRRQEAAEVYRRMLELWPDDPGLVFQIAALSGQEVPAAMPAAVVRGVFDRHAATFDRHLVNRLQYRVPQLLLEAVTAAGAQPGLDVVDLGCGTGLCGELFRGLAATLVGVDLSAGMIEQARRRALYDRLEVAEMIQALRAGPSRYDLALAADVLCYVGDLSEVFRAVAAALRPGALFAFSVELHDASGWVLRPTRRYAHAAEYVREQAAINRFEPVQTRTETLRTEAAQDVAGLIVVLRRQ